MTQTLAMTKIYTEKRKDTRYTVKERVLTSIRPSPEETYHVLNISMGGMAFRYLGDTRRYKENVLGGDLVLNRSGLILENLTFEIISDQLTGDSFIPMRRCGVQFKNMSEEQYEKLEKLITHCSTDEVGTN